MLQCGDPAPPVLVPEEAGEEGPVLGQDGGAGLHLGGGRELVGPQSVCGANLAQAPIQPGLQGLTCPGMGFTV